MDTFWKNLVWQQFGASIDMLENAMLACPDELWNDVPREPRFWHITYHTLFFLDLYLSDSVETFAPPAPFTREELEPDGGIPETPHTKEELQRYLQLAREKCRTTIRDLAADKAQQRCGFAWVDVSVAELLLYNMRHVQHHAAQLNLILREKTGSAPRWVFKANQSFG
jgi:hypothetical protein